MAWAGPRRVEEAELAASPADGRESLGMFHPNRVRCPDDRGKTIRAGFLLLCLSGELIRAADFHLWGLDHFSKRLFKTGSSRHIGKQRQKKAKLQQCLFHFSFTALSSLHLWRGKPAERDVASPCGKQIVRCLRDSWPSPGAGSSDQPSENKWKMVWSTWKLVSLCRCLASGESLSTPSSMNWSG